MSDSDGFDGETIDGLPDSFGRQQSIGLDAAAQIERARRIPLKIKSEKKQRKQDEEDEEAENNHDDDEEEEDDDDDDDDDDEDEDEFPTTHGLTLKTHDRPVTTLCADPAGGRFLAGSTDGTIKMHDFVSMAPNALRAFKSIDPWCEKPSSKTESHAIHAIRFGPHWGGAFLCVTAHPQAQIISRDGAVLTEFVKGDMYLRDMHHTKGHISEITTGTWHLEDRNLVVTAGTDSTLRIWDVNNKRSQKDVIVFKSKAAGSGGRSRMTTVALSAQAQGAAVIMSTALDGSLVMWPSNGPFTRPAAEVKAAHEPGTWTSGLAISADGRTAVTRGGDDAIKLWDMRKLTQAVVSIAHESTSDRFPTSNIQYSPNSDSIITGSATGHLHILNPGNLRAEHVTEVTPGSALIAVDWHPKLNQILTGSASGETNILFTPTRSTRGAIEVLSRPPRKRHFDDDPALTMDHTSLGFSPDSIVTPGAQRRVKSSRRKAQPQNMQQTPFMRTQPDEKHVQQNIPLARMLHEDPREALLRYADIAREDPMFTSAWKETQPVTEYAQISDDEQQAERARERKRVRR